MEEKDREIRLGGSRLYLGEDNIIYIVATKNVDEKTETELITSFFKLVNMAEGKVHVLFDINKVGKPSHGARKIGREVLENEKVGKVAFFGLHPVARVIASFMIGVTKKKDIRSFKTKEKALAWLKE